MQQTAMHSAVEELTYARSRAKALGWLLGCGLFVAFGWSMIQSGRPFGWAALLLGGSVALILIASLVSGKVSLRLDRDGFEVAGLLRRTKVRWTEVDAPVLGELSGVRAITFKRKVDLRPPAKTAMSPQNPSDYAVMDGYSASLDEIFAAMSAWHARFAPDVSSLYRSNAPAAASREHRRDLSWPVFFIVNGALFFAYLLVAILFLGKAVESALYGYAAGLAFIGALFALASRTIRWRGYYPGFGHPHPRFPSGEHPSPKLQFMIGMFLFSGFQLLMFWPWGKS
jgi:hypothetical protein